jgi:D-aminoacyl-tRNA deacylase
MRAVVQRVLQSRVRVEGKTVGEIGRGLLVLLGAGQGDTDREAEWMAKKLMALRIFQDEASKMNRSVVDVSGSMLVVSQFTLYGDCQKGNRPSFVGALEPREAERLYLKVVEHVRASGMPCATGVFGAHMEVELVNDGPVTLILDSVKS